MSFVRMYVIVNCDIAISPVLVVEVVRHSEDQVIDGLDDLFHRGEWVYPHTSTVRASGLFIPTLALTRSLATTPSRSCTVNAIDDDGTHQQQQQPAPSTYVNQYNPQHGPSHPTQAQVPRPNHSQYPQQYPQYSYPQQNQQPYYPNTNWPPAQPPITVTQSQMQYSQFQQQGQQVYQHQHQHQAPYPPQVQARPPLSQQQDSPPPSHTEPSSSVRSHRRHIGSSSSNKVISAEEDIQRLLNVCKAGRGNAALLHEALVYAKPDDLKEKGLTQEFLGRCRSSQDFIFSQIPWATAEAERSRRAARSSKKETKEEHLLAELLGANEELLEAIKVYNDLERVGIEQGALERVLADQKLRALTAITSFHPTPSESSLVNQIFDMADTRRIGNISSHAAVKIFSGSKLSPNILADIWRIANVEESELLSRQVVGVAVRLIGHAQRSRGKVDEGWVSLPGPLANIEGLESTGGNNGPVAGPSSSSSTANLPPLTSDDRNKFMKIFMGCGPANGVLNGNRARAVLMKSRLPTQMLAHIWELADVQQRGYLDATSFIVAMYLVQAAMSGKVKTLPPSLPSSVYFDASPHLNSPASPSAITSPLSPTSSSFLHSPIHGTSSSSSSRAAAWDVTKDEKATADEFFNVLDEQHKGYIDGKSARAHFLLSGLSEPDVKQIWSLVDINGDGQLGRDEFAVALHLIQAQQKGGLIPKTLPEGLIPPALRQPSAPANEELLIDLTDTAPLVSIPPLRPTFTGLSPSPTSPNTSSLLSGLPSTSHQFLQPPLTNTSRFSSNPLPSRVVSEPSTRPSTNPSSPIPPSMSILGSVSQPNLPPSSPTMTTIASASMSSLNGSTGSIPPGWTWDVTPAEKASSDRFFDILDPWKHGYIEGEAAVPFLSKSKLPEAVLAKIWDLADADTDGRLSREDFAVAMHLIKGKLAGKDVPDSLPPSLVPPPPSARVEPQEVSPFDDPIAPTPAVPAPPVPHTPSSAQERRASDAERPPPPAPAESEQPPAIDDPPRSQTPPPPYALVDAIATED